MLEVSIGGVIALAVSLLVLPARAHSFVIEGAARTLDLMARSLPELFEGFIRPRDAAAIARIQDSIGEAVARTRASAAEAKHERIVFLAAEPDHGPLMRTLTRLRHDLRSSRRLGLSASRSRSCLLALSVESACASVARITGEKDEIRQRHQARR